MRLSCPPPLTVGRCCHNKAIRLACRHHLMGGGDMKEDGFDRRSFLKGTVAGGAAAMASSLPRPSEAQPKAVADAPSAPPAAYAFLNADEAAFVEAVVDH